MLFEKENFTTLTMISKFMMALYGSFAQEESESISKMCHGAWKKRSKAERCGINIGSDIGAASTASQRLCRRKWKQSSVYLCCFLTNYPYSDDEMNDMHSD